MGNGLPEYVRHALDRLLQRLGADRVDLCYLHRVESAVPIEGVAEMVRHRRGYLLLEWIRQAGQDAPKPMKGFAGSLRQDLHAVTAGLTLLWSSGVVEGHMNRVGTLKRAMYGRASFDLLRTRILTRS